MPGAFVRELVEEPSELGWTGSSKRCRSEMLGLRELYIQPQTQDPPPPPQKTVPTRGRLPPARAFFSPTTGPVRPAHKTKPAPLSPAPPPMSPELTATSSLTASPIGLP